MTKEEIKKEFEKKWYSHIESGSMLTVQRGCEQFWKFIDRSVKDAVKEERERVFSEIKEKFRKYHDKYSDADFYDFIGIIDMLDFISQKGVKKE